jgi:hypothetical protein
MADFGEALTHLRAGLHVTRSRWQAQGEIGLQPPDQQSLMSLPFLYLMTAAHERVPWVASQTDLLADDWVLVVEA